MGSVRSSSRNAMIFLTAVLASGLVSGCGGSQIVASSAATSSTAATTATNAATSASSFANVTIGTTQGQAISSTFMGLSHEWGVQDQMGSSLTSVDYVYRQMLNNLTAYGSGPMILRIGGNSTDKTGEPTSTTAIPFAELAKDLGVHFYLGVNLGAADVNLAVDQAKAYISQVPNANLDGLEIGNEPDDYVQNGTRTAPYTFQNYLAEFNIWKDNITPLLPSNSLLTGAVWSDPQMLSYASTYIGDESDTLSTFSQHDYLGSLKTLSQNDVLLEPSMSTTAPASVASAVVTAHNQGIPFRMGEIGAFYDSTSTSVNNSFEAALWAIDIMFEYAKVGVDGVNWHGNPSVGALYTSFSVASNTAGGSTTYSLATVYPLYYGLLFFQEATGNSAHLLPLTLSTNANLKAWATIDSLNTTRLVLINKDEASAGTVSVTPPAGFSHAQVLRMAAPSYLSTTGVTLGGQTFDGSTDGTIQGAQSTETLGLTNGTIQIPMPITSAALVVFTK